MSGTIRVRRRAVIAAAAALTMSLLGAVGAPAASAAPCPTVSPSGQVQPALLPGQVWDSCSLAGADLRGVDLSYSSFRFANLAGARLAGATMVGVDFTGVTLSDADLTGADLTASDVVFAHLAGAKLNGALLTATWLDYTDIANADLTGASAAGLSGKSVTGTPLHLPAGWVLRSGHLAGPAADLRGAVLNGVHLEGVNLTGADLSGASLANGILTHATLTGADLRGTYFDFANLTGVVGLASAWTNRTTSFAFATCPDGKGVDKHVGRTCLGALDTIAPVASLSTASPFATTNRHTFRTAVAEKGSGVATWHYRWAQAWNGGTALGRWQYTAWGEGSAASVTVTVNAGYRLCAQVQVRDIAGNLGAWSTLRCVDALQDDMAGSFGSSASWRNTPGAGSAWFNGSYSQTTTRGAAYYAMSSRTIRQLGVVATTCPTCGSVAFYVGSRKVGSVSLARTTTTPRAVLLLPRLTTPLSGAWKVVVTSSGRLVRLDGIAVTSF